MAERLTPFGKYFLLERINVGGMAEVFKAKTVGVEGFEKIVAIKRILPSVAEDEEFIRMFVDEAKITSQLSHANLAQTFDLGKVNDSFYIALEYVPGKDLRAAFERLKRRGERMPLNLCAYIVARLCEGLDYAHRKRDLAGRELHIVHRDVSPQNVILSFEGEVKLIDFGIAKAANKMIKTQAGILKGKFGYMSPEQVRGLPLDGRSDIFAAGIVLYELCTGERLFTGNSDYSVLEKVQQAKVTAPSSIEPSIPLKLERVILKALAREPEERYQHASDLAADLQRYLLELPRPVTRDDLAAFMKGMFPDDNAREAQAALESSRPRPALPPERKPAPRIREDAGQGQPPPLPASLTEGLSDDDGKVLGEGDPDATYRGPAPADAPRAEIIVRSKLQSQDLIAPSAPPPPTLPPDVPTRPMSMTELAAAERAFAARTRSAPPSVHVEEEKEPTAPGLPLGGPDEPTPVERPFSRPAPPLPVPEPRALPPDREEAEEPDLHATEPEATRPEATLPDGFVPPADPVIAPPVTRAPAPAVKGGTEAPRARQAPPKRAEPRRPEPRPRPAEARPAPPSITEPTPMAPPEPAPRLDDQETAVRPRPRPYGGRMALSAPTLVADDAAAPDESTVSRSRRRIRVAQLAVAGLALAIAAWALLSSPRSRKHAPAEAAAGTAALRVKTEPADAVLLLDGAQVKGEHEAQWNEPGLTAGVDHVLTARREGFNEQSMTVNLKPGEESAVTLRLPTASGELVVRSSPPGAQVFVDGERKGVTPAYLPGVDGAHSHAISLEKKCFRAWQVAVPAQAGRRELAATLEPSASACPGRPKLERSEGMPAPDVPDEGAAGTLGFLSLGSRPPANVIIDGVDIGRVTPLLSWPLKPGSHRVRLVASAAPAGKDLGVEIRSGETHSEIVELAAAAPAHAKKRGRR